MSIASFRRILFTASLALVALCFAGCGDKEAKWNGTYISEKDHMTLVIKPEHKGSLSAEGVPGDLTWEMAGDDKIIVHAGIPISMFMTSDGNLRDEEGTVWKKK